MLSTKVLLVLLLGVASSRGEEQLEAGTIAVQTTHGKVLGSYGEKTIGSGKILYWFRGIPYAEPPVGDLRFEAPVPKKSWQGTLDVRTRQPYCVQGSDPLAGSEDCLYLKVYTDKKPSPYNKLPVMVYIYGGGFYSGYADFDDHSPDYLLDQDVIVVAIHYRVGFLGFLSLGDTVAPGNNGIRDQILALKWIKQNIKNFGGDPNKITVFGQSAGAASVAYLLQTDEAKGLFSKAIIQSGSSLSPWALAKSVPAVTKDIATALKINTGNSASILAGLKKVDVETLQKEAVSKMNSQLMGSNPLQGLVFGPVTEPEHKNAIITGKSHERLSKGEFHHIPLIIGYTSLEGYFNSLPSLLRLWLLKYDINKALLVPLDMNVGSITRTVLGNNIKTQYFGSSSVASSNEKIMRFIADTQFEKPIQESIRLYSQKTKVYAYHFNYEGPLWGRTDRKTSGVGHTEDLGYLFDFGHKGSDADYLTRSRMVKLWTNFVKTGNPTPRKEPLLENIQWPANTGSDDLKYLEVNKKLSITGLPNKENINYWKKAYQNNGKPPYSTY